MAKNVVFKVLTLLYYVCWSWLVSALSRERLADMMQGFRELFRWFRGP
jgi:hypothetical protein